MLRTEGERTPGFKLLLAILIGAALVIPLFSVWLLVYDRQTQSEQATASITEGWGGPQAIHGPVLVIPYRATAQETVIEGGQSVTRSRDVRRELTLSPEVAEVSTSVAPERRKRSIYEAVVYDAKLNGSARFAFPALFPIRHELILIGGGHAHVLLLRKFGINPLRNIRVTLISDVEHAAYSGMLPGHISGIYSREEMFIDLRQLCDFSGARFIHSQAYGIDLKRKRVLIGLHGSTLPADVISINIGGTSYMAGIAGADEWAIPTKPVPELLRGWARVQAATAHARMRIVIVGGGAGGVELALAMHSKLRNEAEFSIIHAGPHLLPGYHPRARGIVESLLHARRVTVVKGRRVVEVMQDRVRLDGGETLPADFVFWAAQAAPPTWLEESGLDTTSEGFVRVAPTLQTPSHPWIFAAGDVAAIPNLKLPKSGVFAVRMAKPLERNLRAYFACAPLRAYQPQRHSLSLIGTADGRAIASYGTFAGHSALFWRWKDWIDRRFMKQFVKPTH